MIHSRRSRVRVVIGSAVVVIAGVSAAGQLAASSQSVPPTSEPDSSEPTTETTPALDPQREEIVDEMISAGEDVGFPLDRECLAGIVAQVPDADIPIIAAEIAESTATSIGDADAGTVPAGTEPLDSMPQLSAEAEALGEQLISCVMGDADPELVEQAVAVLAADEMSANFDMDCVENVLSTFDDETLQLIVDTGGTAAIGASVPDSSVVSMESALDNSILLLACSTATAATVDAPSMTIEAVEATATTEA